MFLRLLSPSAAVALIALCAAPAWAQDYPVRPVRLFAAEAGGGADFGARLVAQALTPSLGEQVFVDNRGLNAIELAARAAPDGYSLLYYGSTVWVLPLMQEVRYDPVRDLAAISLVNTQPSILVVHPSLPVTSVRELIALAKARPGELNYATGPAGSSGHLASELFKTSAYVNLVRIPYKGNGPANIALLAGQVQLTFGTTGAMAPYLKARKLRAIAVTSAKPSPLAPGLPTVAASGLPGYEAATLTGIFAPAKTPAPILDKLSEHVVRVLHQTDVQRRFLAAGVETVGGSPEEFAATIKSETAKWGKLVKDAGIRAE